MKDFIEYTNEDIENLTNLLIELSKSRIEIRVFDWEHGKVNVYHVKDLEDLLSQLDFEQLVTDVLGLVDPIGQVAQWIISQLSGFASWIVDQITSWFKATGLYDTIFSIFDYVKKIPSIISDLGKIWDWIQNIGKVTLDSIFNAISEASKFLTETIPNFVNSILPKLDEALKLATQIPSMISNIIKSISDFTSKLPSMIQESIKTISETLGKVPSMVQELINSISKFVTEGSKALQEFLKSLTELPAKAPSIIQSITALAYKQVIEPIQKQVIEPLWNWIKSNIVDPLMKYLREDIPKAFEQVMNGLKLTSQAITGFINAILKFPEWFPRWFSENIAKPITQAISWLAEQLWKLLPDWLKNAIIMIQEGINAIAKGLQEFLKDPLGFIQRGFSWLADQIWKMLPDWLKNAITMIQEALQGFWNWITTEVPKFFDWIQKEFWKGVQEISNFFSNLWKGIQEFTSDPLGWLKRNVFNPFLSWLSSIGSELWKIAQSIYSYVIQGLTWLGQQVWGAIQGFIGWLEGVAKGIIETIMKQIIEPVQSALEEFTTEFKKILVTGMPKEIAEQYLKQGVGEIDLFLPLSLSMLSRIAYPLFLSSALAGVGEASGDQEISGEPLGVGGKIRLRLGKVWSKLPDTAKKIINDIFEGFVVGLAFNLFDALRYHVKYHLRNILPLYIPSDSFVREVVQRHFPMEEFEEYIKWMRWILALKGYDDKSLDFWTSDKVVVDIETRANIVYPDLAGKTTKFREGLVYSIPTPSELCRMMIRDIFKSPKDFIDVMKMHGFDPSISVMYYLLHFKYPSPSTLWEFGTRAWAYAVWKQYSEKVKSGAGALLWYLPAIGKDISMEDVSAYFDYVLPTYMKWHDYIDQSWFRGIEKAKKFAEISDREIVIELLADMPTRIDARWMWKWGILTPFDIGILALARGLHPSWIDKVTVAECMNALTEERTFLRTGFINLFKEGFYDYGTIEKLLAGFFKLKFLVPVYKQGKITVEEVEYPVMFLEGERKLLELRAIMDRALDILRDAVSRFGAGVRENIISVETFITKLAEVVDLINKGFFVPVMSKVMGIRPEQVPKIIIDETYYKAYAKVLEFYRFYDAVSRLRYWFNRLLWNIFYQLSRGYIEVGEAQSIISEIAKRAFLTKYEEESLKWLAVKFVEYGKRELVREYIPTPVMMITMLEYVPEAWSYFKEVLERRRVPAHWIKVWELYANRRVVYDEIRHLLTRYERLFEVGGMNIKKMDDMFKELSVLGFTEPEIKLRRRAFLIYRHIYVLTRIVPSATALTNYYRYSSLAKNLLDIVLKNVVDEAPIERGLKEAIKKFFSQMIINRAVYTDMRGYIYELISAYAEGVINDAQLMSELNYLKKYGLKDQNIELIVRRAKLRRARYQARGRW